jgi:hypothetical protein
MTKGKSAGSSGATGTSSLSVPPANPQDKLQGEDVVPVVQIQATVEEVLVPMPKVPCKIDLNAVDLLKQMEDFNDAFRDALIVANKP